MRRRCWCSGIPMTAGRPAGTGRDLSTAAAEVHAECWRCIEILFRRCLPRPWSDYLLGEEPLVTARRPVDMASALRPLLVARTRAARDKVDATFAVHDVSAPLRFADASLGGVLAILVVQHLPNPAAFIADIRRCLRPGGHLLITAPARDSTSRTSQSPYWRLRAACYQLVPGVVRFYDTNSLPRLVEDQGLTVVKCDGGTGRVSVLARA